VKIRPNLRTALAYGFLHDRDILHAHFATDSAALAMELSKLLGKPFTFTVHAYDIFLKENSKNKFLKKKIDSAYKVISISEFNKRYLLDLFDINPNKIEVIHMGVRPNQYLHSSRKRGSKQIITLSRLVEKKGLLTLIEAFSLLNNWKIDFHATIVGEGPLRQKLLESIIQYGLSDRVSLSINLVDEQVDSMLAASTMFVLPCKRLENGDMDGIPVGMIEAMAAGLPVVSTNISGIPELVEDGVTGFLVPMENAHELAKAMKKVLDNPRLRKEMGERGVSKIAREFNITTEVRKLVYVWRRILESKKQPEATIISNFEV
jgi:glycosyltransferase involved in cell wall biosynthesis